jgi:hypothetical protein
MELSPLTKAGVEASTVGASTPPFTDIASAKTPTSSAAAHADAQNPGSIRRAANASITKTRMKLVAQSAFFVSSLKAGSSARHDSFKTRQRSHTDFERQERIIKNQEAAQFDAYQFVFTFILEVAPIYIVSPFIVILAKGWEKGVNCCGHRALLPLPAYAIKTEKYTVRQMVKFLCVVIMNLGTALLPWIAILVFNYYPDEMKQSRIDGLEVLCTVSVVFIRPLVIATK